MTTPGTGKAREGKYCPRCRAMTFRDREICEHCGHQFRTGLGAPPLDAPIMDEATLHRTMQFTLPPLPPRGGVAAPAPSEVSRGTTTRTHRRGASVVIPAAVALGLALAGALAHLHHAQTARVVKSSPAGVWETAPVGPQDKAKDMRLRLALREDGGGSFSWGASGGAPPRPSPGSEETPLRWRLDPDSKLVLSITPPAAADAASGTLIMILDSHPWLWRVDQPRHRLIIGTLSFTEK